MYDRLVSGVLMLCINVFLSKWLIWCLCFRFDTLAELGAFVRTKFVYISVWKVALGPRVKLAGRKSALNAPTPSLPPPSPPPPTNTHTHTHIHTTPRVAYATDCSKAVVTMLVLLFVASMRRFVLSCVILFLYFSVLLALRFTSLREERANLSAVRTFVRFALVWFCLFPLPLRIRDGLRLVILTLPGLFSYPFLYSLSSRVGNAPDGGGAGGRVRVLWILVCYVGWASASSVYPHKKYPVYQDQPYPEVNIRNISHTQKISADISIPPKIPLLSFHKSVVFIYFSYIIIVLVNKCFKQFPTWVPFLL